MTTGEAKRRTFGMKAMAILALAVLALITLACLPHEAHADSLAFVKGSQKKAVRIADTVTAKEKTAYKRALAMCLDYENQPNPVVVDVSDLGLTDAQALHVGYMLHSNGELFWVNSYDDNSFKRDKFTIPLTHDDAAITKMREALEVKLSKVLKRVPSGMDAVTAIHTLHDYVIDTIEYGDHYKTAYDGLVLGKCDCFGFAQTMDLLLRRAGFTTDMAYRNDGLHAWNQVVVGGKWYHVDVTWDNGWTGKYFWNGVRCHRYLLQSDNSLVKEQDQHRGWWANHKCTSDKYVESNGSKNKIFKNCKGYKLYVNGFTSSGIKYKLCSAGKVRVASVGAAKAAAKKIVIPNTVTYKHTTYKVAGIQASAFSGAKATVLTIASGSMTAKYVKDGLVGSKVKKVKLAGLAKKKKAAYAKAFTEANCGKSVKVA